MNFCLQLEFHLDVLEGLDSKSVSQDRENNDGGPRAAADRHERRDKLFYANKIILPPHYRAIASAAIIRRVKRNLRRVMRVMAHRVGDAQHVVAAADAFCSTTPR